MKKIHKFFLSFFTVFMTNIMPLLANDTHEALEASLPVWSVLPFVGMLLSIAVIPLVKPHWWEKNMHWLGT